MAQIGSPIRKKNADVADVDAVDVDVGAVADADADVGAVVAVVVAV